MSDLSIVQQEYVSLVKMREIFEVRGQSLICRGRIYPIAMAKSIRVKPRRTANFEELEKAWNKY